MYDSAPQREKAGMHMCDLAVKNKKEIFKNIINWQKYFLIIQLYIIVGHHFWDGPLSFFSACFLF